MDCNHSISTTRSSRFLGFFVIFVDSWPVYSEISRHTDNNSTDCTNSINDGSKDVRSMEQTQVLVEEAAQKQREINRPTWLDHWRTFRELILSLGSWETYQIHRNLYFIMGIIWSLPAILVFWVISAEHLGYDRNASGVLRLLHDKPVYLILLGFSLFFTLFLASLGQVKHRRDRYIRALLRELEGNVRRLSSANEELKELDRLRDEFTSNITHELRTPLVTTRGYTEMLLSGELGEIDDTQRRAIRVIHKNIMRLIELIDQILQFRKMGSAPLPRQLRPFPLRHLLRDLEDNFRPTFIKKEISFAIDLPDRPIMVVGDRSRIERVFTNLISNATKFTPRGGSIRIDVNQPTGGYVPVSVTDTGCGIPRDAQPHIFDRYRQADGSVRRKFGGTGLGLAIVRRILQAHGVDIAVESEVGKGSCFTFDLPIMVETGKTFDVVKDIITDRG